MFELREICTCNHCLKTCEGMQEINKSKWFHFRKKLNDDETDLTNSVDFCPDCAKLLAAALREYMANGGYEHLGKTELEIENLYKDLYLNIYALVLMYIIKGGRDLPDFVDAIPGEVTFSSVHKADVIEYEISFNTLAVHIQQNGIATNLRTEWNDLTMETNAITVHRLTMFLSSIDSPVDLPLFYNVYPKDSNAATIEYLTDCIRRLEECGSRGSCSGAVSYLCSNIICLIRHTVNLIREK